jgi:copper chaperone CopZ
VTVRETFTVQGMTCDHCVQSVATALQALPGVEQVTVYLPTGTVDVTGTEPLPTESVRGAVKKAGYDLVR